MMESTNDNVGKNQVERILQYREKIVEMIGQIEEEKFLRRIYIIISDNIKEKPE